MTILRKAINVISVFAAFCLFLSVPPAEAALPNGLQDVYTIFTTGTPPLIQNSPYDIYGRDGGSYVSWSSTDFKLTYDGGPVGTDASPGIINELPAYPPVGAFITHSYTSTGFDTNEHWMKVSANNSTLGSFQLNQLVVEGAGSTASGGSCSFTVNIIGNKLAGGTVQTGNINYVIELGIPKTLTLTNVSGEQLTSFEIHFTATNNFPSPANFTFQNFTVSNAMAPLPPPTVTGILPTSGSTAGGTSVTITGTNLLYATAVKFGSANATSYTINSGTQITATAPASSAGTVDKTVTTAGGASSTSASDQFTYISPPTVATNAASSISATGAT